MTQKNDGDIPVYAAKLGYACGSTIRGASHEADQSPCQDAYSIWTGSFAGKSSMILAVADGHGAEKHDRSQYGSFWAVKAAVDVLISLQASSGDDVVSLTNNFKSNFPRLVARKWRELVKEDDEKRTGQLEPKENKLEHLENTEEDLQKIYSRYGTTLLVAFIISDMVLAAKIGDGNILFVRSPDTTEDLFEERADIVGVETDSLSSSDAQLLFQTVKKGDGGLLILSTDGLFNAFKDKDQFHLFSQSLLDRISEYGIKNVSSSIPDWLHKYSKEGSGDDITLVLAYVEPEPVHTEPNVKVSSDNPDDIGE